MADLTITAASVIAGSGASIDRSGIAGATIAAGKAVYQDAATGKYLLADDNSATAAARVPAGIALNGASDGQPLAILRGGDITIGAALTPGVVYYLSDTPGGIGPVADLAAGNIRARSALPNRRRCWRWTSTPRALRCKPLSWAPGSTIGG
jgi:hypothetical protein